VCPTGDQLVYAGYAGGLIGAWSGGWGAGGPICMADGTFGGTWTNWASALVVRTIGSSGSNRIQYQNSADIRCALCRPAQ
jgi:hypothetical protein